MLTTKDLQEMAAMSSDELRWCIKVMWYQVNAKFLVGDRNRSIAITEEAQRLLNGRVGA
jgi:hypothetical protein